MEAMKAVRADTTPLPRATPRFQIWGREVRTLSMARSVRDWTIS